MSSFGNMANKPTFGTTTPSTQAGFAFGSGGSTNLTFGAKPTTQNNPAATTSSSLFGSTGGTSLFGSTTTTAGSSLFGSTAAPGSSLFGSTTTPGASLFGNTTTPGASLFGNTTTNTTQASSTNPTQATSLSFGQKPATTATPTFGTTAPVGGLLSAGQPAATTTQSSGFSLGNTATQATTQSSSLFGTGITPAASQPAATTSLFSNTLSTAGSLTGNNNPTSKASLFGTATSTTEPPKVAAPLGATQPTGSTLFGSTATTTTSASQPTIAPAPLASSLFGQASSTAPSASTASSNAPALATAVKPAETKAEVQNQITFRQLEEMITKWNQELDDHERHFLNEASKLNQWDHVLIGNANKISDLKSMIANCETEQSRAQQELDFIEVQQRELESLLEPLETAANEFPPSQQHVDIERDSIYQMAISTDLELSQLLSDLKQTAEKINLCTSSISESSITSSPSKDGDNRPKKVDTVSQITHVLNTHMHSLNYIQRKTQDLTQVMKMLEIN